VVLADSQGRTCGSRLAQRLSGDFSVRAEVYPGATLSWILDTAAARDDPDEKEGWLILVGGTNDVTQNSDPSLISDKLTKLKTSSSFKNVILCEVPVRYDKPYLNSAIQDLNSILLKECKKLNFGFLASSSLQNRSSFTSHGLHLSNEGKDLLCNLLEVYIRYSTTPNVLRGEKVQPVFLGVGEPPQDTKVDSGLG